MTNTHRWAIALIVLGPFGRAGGARAQEPRRVTLEEALTLFARNNLELGIARSEANEAAALARQASAFPNPTVSGTHEPLAGEGRSYSETYMNLAQRIEWPGTRSARQDAGARLAESALNRLAADSARIAFDVKAAYTDALQADRTRRVLERVASVFREGENRAQARYSEEDISLYDLRRIHVERVRYETLLAEAELAASSTRRALTLLIVPDSGGPGVAPADAPAGIPPDLPPDGGIIAIALTQRPELRAAAAMVESRRASALVARNERIPDVVATGGYKRQSDGLNGAFLGLSLSLPLWDRREGAIAATDASMTAAESRLRLVTRQVENDVRHTLERYRSLYRLAAIRIGGENGQVNDLLDIAEAAYADGEMELIELLDAAEAQRQAEVADARFRADLWTAWYDMERAAGGSLNSREDS